MNFSNFYNEKIVLKEGLLNPKKSAFEYTDELEKKGWKSIGEGSYGVVFSKPDKDYVIKIFIKDSAYEDYLDFVIMQKNNPHVPRLKRYILPPSYESNIRYGIVAMEKLEPISTKARYSWRASLVPKIISVVDYMPIENMSFKEYTDKIESIVYDFLLKSSRHPRSTLANTHSSKKMMRRLEYFIETYLSLFKTIYDLRKYLEQKSSRIFFDLHANNYMIRPSTGEIVITDPIA